jgi:hypothetical protein
LNVGGSAPPATPHPEDEPLPPVTPLPPLIGILAALLAGDVGIPEALDGVERGRLSPLLEPPDGIMVVVEGVDTRFCVSNEPNTPLAEVASNATGGTTAAK